jgi:hypothetical protein
MMMMMMMIIIIIETETESEIVAAHDQALQTKYHATKILQTETVRKCKLYQQFDETVDHVTSACPILTKEQNIKRHDTACDQIHCNICMEIGAKLYKQQWYEHVPQLV